jgi:hypothetical protein
MRKLAVCEIAQAIGGILCLLSLPSSARAVDLSGGKKFKALDKEGTDRSCGKTALDSTQSTRSRVRRGAI